MLAPTIKLSVLAASLALSAFSLNAHATLKSYTSDGKDLVYSSVSNVTWTKDGNLLRTLFASQGFNTVVNAIIAASPTISNTPNPFSPTGAYTLKTSDFSSDGSTSWWGALGYVNYLNSISYGGINNWYLPTVANPTFGYNTATNGTAKGDELAELYYQELGSKGFVDVNGDFQPDFGIVDPNNTFTNEQSYAYWSGTEYPPDPDGAWVFVTRDGSQRNLTKYFQYYAWAVSPGQVAAVPEPESVAMLLIGLGVAGGVARRRRG